MSKSTTATPKATTRPKAAFSAASFANLRSVTGEAQGDALRILLADIDEDPDQPRTQFDDADLEAMAASIREFGVVQPITVKPPVDGRYMLVFGARRVRAARLAGQADIPAVIRNPSPDDYAAQIIENQQRSNLSNSDLAAAIARLWETKTNKQIGAICNLKDYQVAAFRQADKFPPELRERLDKADMRALYDLFRQWQKTPDEVIAALPGADTFITVTEARRIVSAITGKATGSIVLDRPVTEAVAEPDAPVVAVQEAAPAEEEQPEPMQQLAPEATLPPSPALNIGIGLPEALSRPTALEKQMVTVAVPAPVQPIAPAPQPAPPVTESAHEVEPVPAEPVFIVAGRDGQQGQLVTDRRAARAGYALVAYAEGVEEVDATALRIVEVK